MMKRWIKVLLVIGLIAILAACTGSEQAAEPTSPPTPVEDSEDQAPAESEEGEESEESSPGIDAAALFSANCARCHGADRVSGGAPDLIPDNLTKDRQVYIDTITNGSSPMPTFGSELSAEEINALVDFVLSAP